MPDFNGILCIDKPADFTSFDVVAKLRGIAGTKKIGHAGTLDPMATGVLPVFFGRGTKACDILPCQDKRYTATLRLGISTDTQDITGKVISERTVNARETDVKAAATRFVGEIQQIPPMYSALKVNGQRLYDLARQGIEVDRAPRPVTIYSLDFLSCDATTHTYQIDVHCSKGTYIRTLAADLGEALGCGATLTALRRTMAAGFPLDCCITIEQAGALAQADKLAETAYPVERAFASLPRVSLNHKQSTMFLNGVRMDPTRIQLSKTDGRMAVYSPENVFLGIAALVGVDFKMVKLFALAEDFAK